MTITADTIAAGLAASGARFKLQKVLPTMEGAGTYHSMWKIAGPPSAAAGASPPLFSAGSGYIPTRATAGALGQTNPTNNKYLALLDVRAPVTGTLLVFDRMWACSGFATDTVSTQTITTPGTLTPGRDPLAGLDVEPWLEVYTVPGATAATWTLTGTDATGTSGRTWTYAHPANAETLGQIMPMVPGTAIGGCQVPTSFACSISSGGTGSIGVTLMRQLAAISTSTANVESVKDAFQLGMPEVYDDACLFFVWLASATTGQRIDGTIGIPELTP